MRCGRSAAADTSFHCCFAAIEDEAEVTAHNGRIEHLSNAINSTYGILYCHLSFKPLAV
ncbi:hypothetical protein [Morganella sp. HSTU-ASny43]|uniref:hypothetical protein n=1 Tax=Morganella sp. HSTU-ASny43 TaxID=2681968 RepID=UPI001FB85115|nr:hypothetical protein [Morganella sp. HSTU-ASny43]